MEKSLAQFRINEKTKSRVDLEEQILMNKEMAIKELDQLSLNISKNIDEKEEIYNAIIEKYVD